ncbi:hypothetical protein [Gilvimarinus sp. DA14]|uniref:hypothetical protein n=1 Tax=Gilvimarinus sp. DA14 TaxID=2956798 RepID=UPI0020B6B722|nr:hypothetical protein [Gilvimarinus sp. DA14]UTF61285.1 hypothetical protein NHM04_05655 [Gilvimarinus sp. DA14]
MTILKGCVFKTTDGSNWVIRFNAESCRFSVKPNTTAAVPAVFATHSSPFTHVCATGNASVYVGSLTLNTPVDEAVKVADYINDHKGAAA